MGLASCGTGTDRELLVESSRPKGLLRKEAKAAGMWLSPGAKGLRGLVGSFPAGGGCGSFGALGVGSAEGSLGWAWLLGRSSKSGTSSDGGLGLAAEVATCMMNEAGLVEDCAAGTLLSPSES